jgi:DNA-binding response OmpR family regulator
VRNGQETPLGSKAFEILVCLVSHAGSLVTKEELLRTVWPDAFVDESNLAQHVFAIRKRWARMLPSSRPSPDAAISSLRRLRSWIRRWT